MNARTVKQAARGGKARGGIPRDVSKARASYGFRTSLSIARDAECYTTHAAPDPHTTSRAPSASLSQIGALRLHRRGPMPGSALRAARLG